jgi:FkbM family methyltransferase
MNIWPKYQVDFSIKGILIVYIFLRSSLRKVFSFFNLGLVKNKDLANLQQIFIDYTCLLNKLEFFLLFEKKLNETKSELFSNINFLVESKSQNGQDLFALLSNDFKKGGVFIEFGAYDGVIFSNTHLLEKQFGWTGILIDPIPSHFEGMKLNRKCKLIHGAITVEKQDSVLIEELPASDLSMSVNKRKIFMKAHKVKAFTLSEVIDQNLSSNEIDFLSIDIEGNDLDILKSLDLNRYKIKAVCVEHNFREGLDEIKDYMDKNGYDLVYSEFSKNDYWFVLRR